MLPPVAGTAPMIVPMMLERMMVNLVAQSSLNEEQKSFRRILPGARECCAPCDR